MWYCGHSTMIHTKTGHKYSYLKLFNWPAIRKVSHHLEKYWQFLTSWWQYGNDLKKITRWPHKISAKLAPYNNIWLDWAPMALVSESLLKVTHLKSEKKKKTCKNVNRKRKRWHQAIVMWHNWYIIFKPVNIAEFFLSQVLKQLKNSHLKLSHFLSFWLSSLLSMTDYIPSMMNFGIAAILQYSTRQSWYVIYPINFYMSFQYCFKESEQNVKTV